jgi:hypothetical protein
MMATIVETCRSAKSSFVQQLEMKLVCRFLFTLYPGWGGQHGKNRFVAVQLIERNVDVLTSCLLFHLV